MASPPPSPIKPSTVLRWTCNLVLALTVLCVWTWWATRPEGPRAKTPRVSRLEARLAEHSPDLVLLGNSLVYRAVDPEALMQQLGLPHQQAQIVHLQGNGGAASYVQLKNRIYANGHRPDLVVVCHLLEDLLDRRWPEGQALQRLQEELGPSEPLLARKLGGHSELVQRYRVRRNRFRQQFLERVRNTALRLILPRLEEETPPAGETVARETAPGQPDDLPAADDALARVFAQENLDLEHHGRVIPIVERRQRAALGSDLDLQGSLVPDLVDLAQAHGSRIVFLRPPIRPGTQRDQVDMAMQEEVAAYLDRRDAHFLDLSQANLPRTLFMDPLHMSPAGRDEFTQLLARSLRGMPVLDHDRATLPLQPLRPASIQRLGQPDRLRPLPRPARLGGCRSLFRLPRYSALSDGLLASQGHGLSSPLQLLEDGAPLAAHQERGCSGSFFHRFRGLEVAPLQPPAEQRSWSLTWSEELPMRSKDGREFWWVYPGTRLELAFDQAWDPRRGDFAIDFALSRTGAGELSVGLYSDGQGEDEGWRSWALDERHYQRMQLLPEAPRGSWRLSLAAEAGGSPALVHAVRVGGSELDRAHFAIGRPRDLEPPAVELVGLGSSRVSAHYNQKPKTIPVLRQWHSSAAGEAHTEPKSTRQVHMEVEPHLYRLGHDSGRAPGSLGEPCNPLQVWMNDEALVSSPGWQAADHKQPQAAHTGEDDRGHFLVVSVPAGRVENNPRLELRLIADRQCREMRWLYPADRLRLIAPGRHLARLADGVRRIALQAEPWAPETDTSQMVLKLYLTRNGKVVGSPLATGRVLLSRLAMDRIVEVDLGRTLSLNRGKLDRDSLALVIDQPDQGFVLLRSLQLLGPGELDLPARGPIVDTGAIADHPSQPFATAEETARLAERP